jgi:hypothetical protein
MSKTKGEFIGHCQACGAEQVVLADFGGLAKHGYQVAGFGFFNGICFGSHRPDLETSRELLDSTVKALGSCAKRCDAQAEVYRSGADHPLKVGRLTQHGNRVHHYVDGKLVYPEVEWSAATNGEQARGLENAIVSEVLHAKHARSHAKGLLELATWVHGKPLQPRSLVTRPVLVPGSVVRLYGRSGYDVTVTAVVDQVARGVGPHLNGQRIPHIVYERNGQTRFYPVRLIRTPKISVDNGTDQLIIPSDDLSTSKQETEMSSKKKANGKAKVAKKAAVKASGPSKISQAVAFMVSEIKKNGGRAKLEHGVRKTIIEAAAKKFGLAVPTCNTQYQKQIVAA